MSTKRNRHGERRNVRRVFPDYTLARKDMGEYNSMQPLAIEEARNTEPEIRGVKAWNKEIDKGIKYGY